MATTAIIAHSVDTGFCGSLEKVFQGPRKMKRLTLLSVGPIAATINNIHEYIYVSQ